MIEEEPLRIWMNHFNGLSDHLDPKKDRPTQVPECGTIGCIFGWIVAAERMKTVPIGQQLLDPSEYWSLKSIGATLIDLFEYDPIVTRLSDVPHWPIKFRGNLRWDSDWGVVGNPPVGSPEYANVVAARIRHFIQTDGAE